MTLYFDEKLLATRTDWPDQDNPKLTDVSVYFFASNHQIFYSCDILPNGQTENCVFGAHYLNWTPFAWPEDLQYIGTDTVLGLPTYEYFE